MLWLEPTSARTVDVCIWISTYAIHLAGKRKHDEINCLCSFESFSFVFVFVFVFVHRNLKLPKVNGQINIRHQAASGKLGVARALGEHFTKFWQVYGSDQRVFVRRWIWRFREGPKRNLFQHYNQKTCSPVCIIKAFELTGIERLQTRSLGW